jgi:hypothetical protein
VLLNGVSRTCQLGDESETFIGLASHDETGQTLTGEWFPSLADARNGTNECTIIEILIGNSSDSLISSSCHAGSKL